MPLHQINNTPHLVDIFKKYTSTQVMSVVLPIPDAMKFSRFTKYELKKKIKANQMKINTLYNK